MHGDREIVSRIIEGDHRSFQLLVKQHERLVWHIVLKVIRDEDDVKDICQEVFIKVFQKLSKFQFNAKLSTWIAKIAYRMAIDHAMKSKKWASQEINPEDSREYFIEEKDPASQVEQEDFNVYIRKLIDKLPYQYRTVLTLYHLHEFNYKEIYEITGMPEGTVKNYLFRARKLLKDSITRNINSQVLV
jgi:RNA polymerase sigma-70 factor (ECF subfamily)